MILALLLAATPVVPGDFDHDLIVDRAYLRRTESGEELVVRRGRGGIVVVTKVPHPDKFYFELLAPGVYPPQCADTARGIAGCGVRPLVVTSDTLVFGERGDDLTSGARGTTLAAAIWREGHFEIVPIRK